MAKLSKEEGIQLLEELKGQLDKTKDKTVAIEVLALAGRSVGYAPAMRALVMGVEPASAIRWS